MRVFLPSKEENCEHDLNKNANKSFSYSLDRLLAASENIILHFYLNMQSCFDVTLMWDAEKGSDRIL